MDEKEQGYFPALSSILMVICQNSGYSIFAKQNKKLIIKTYFYEKAGYSVC